MPRVLPWPNARYRTAAEIIYAAVLPGRRNTAIGTALVETCLVYLRAAGVRMQGHLREKDEQQRDRQSIGRENDGGERELAPESALLQIQHALAPLQPGGELFRPRPRVDLVLQQCHVTESFEY